MIEEQAEVIEIIDSQLILQAQTQSACGSCAASKGCGTSVLAKVIGRKFTRFQAANDIGAEVGDTVVVGISEDALLRGSIIMYIIPIFSMLVFALLANAVLAIDVTYRDLSLAASGIIGLGAGSLVSKWCFQQEGSRQRFSPVVLRKIIEHGKL